MSKCCDNKPIDNTELINVDQIITTDVNTSTLEAKTATITTETVTTSNITTLTCANIHATSLNDASANTNKITFNDSPNFIFFYILNNAKLLISAGNTTFQHSVNINKTATDALLVQTTGSSPIFTVDTNTPLITASALLRQDFGITSNSGNYRTGTINNQTIDITITTFDKGHLYLVSTQVNFSPVGIVVSLFGVDLTGVQGRYTVLYTSGPVAGGLQLTNTGTDWVFHLTTTVAADTPYVFNVMKLL